MTAKKEQELLLQGQVFCGEVPMVIRIWAKRLEGYRLVESGAFDYKSYYLEKVDKDGFVVK